MYLQSLLKLTSYGNIAIRSCLTTNSVRLNVLSVYKRILKLSRSWTASDPSKTEIERKYIQDEAKDLFRRNKKVKGIFIY